jgi:glycosyltransferase involved in cell wall biosynthesis
MYPQRLQTLAYFPGIPENIKHLHNKIQVLPFILSMTWKLIAITKKYDIDIINAHWALPPGFLAVVTNKIHKKPVVVTLYGAELFTAKKGSILARLIRYILSRADGVVGISDATCEAAGRISGRQDIEILPDGIDTAYFHPAKDDKGVRTYYEINDDEYMIFACGRMVERKGFRYLLEAMPYILKDCPNTKLVIGGDGPEKKGLEKLIDELGITSKVILPGFIPDDKFSEHMAASDVFVLPSIVDSRGDTEGSATILLEAMASGKPIIGTSVGGIPYAIKDGQGGYLVEPENPKQLAEKITVLLKDENLRKELGIRGRKYVEDNFSCDRIARRYIEKFKLYVEGFNA